MRCSGFGGVLWWGSSIVVVCRGLLMCKGEGYRELIGKRQGKLIL